MLLDTQAGTTEQLPEFGRCRAGYQFHNLGTGAKTNVSPPFCATWPKAWTVMPRA